MNNTSHFLTFLDASILALCLTRTGSHLSFYEGLLGSCWSEKVSYEFFDAALAQSAYAATELEP